jgi:hypothetical protein
MTHYLYVLNGAMLALNVLLYAAHFRFARRANRRLAALAQQVRLDMQRAEVIDFPAAEAIRCR